MKYSLLLFSILFFLCTKLAEAQPNLPDSSHVLVVYNTRSDDSFQIEEYYKNARHIPEVNIVRLTNLVDADIYDPVSATTHQIALQQGEGNEKEIIVDLNNYGWWTVSRHAWIYFNEKIAKPIAEALRDRIVNGDTLKNHIRFIVLCRGVPFRIQARQDDSDSRNQNVPVDGLLCFLGETINNPDALLDLFNSEFAEPWDSLYTISNPYYNADPNFSMNYNFIPNHYKGSFKLFNIQDREITLSYLITHLDATSDVSSVDVVKNMIDSSIAAINSTGYDWFIDTDPTPCAGGSSILHQYDTRDVFNALGITNHFIDVNSETVYTSNPHNKPVMSYISNGTHTSQYPPPNNCILYFQPNFIQSQLDFTYVAGSVFNTAESFNANTLGTYPPIRRDGALMGQLPEFFYKGGTVGVAQVVHGPSTGGIINDNAVMLPAYALGYTFIEAAYLGMTHLTATRVVVGDPLTRIAYPCEPTVLTSNTTLSSGDYDCDIIVPEGIILTLSSSSNINFTRNAELIIAGSLIIENGVDLNFNGFSQLILEENGIMNQGSDAVLNFNNRSKFTLYSNYEIFAGQTINFHSESEFLVEGILTLGLNSSITFNLNSILRVLNTINIHPGVVMTFNYHSRMLVSGYFHCIGEPLNKVTLNFSSTGVEQFFLDNGKAIELDYTTINNGNIRYIGNELENLSITNTSFNSSHYIAAIRLVLNKADLQQVPVIGDCIFNDCSVPAILLIQVQEINIEHNSFNFMSAINVNAINIFNSGTVNIFDCSFSGGLKGIYCTPSTAEDGIEFNENIITDLNINQCYFASNTGIEIGQAISTAAVNINANEFEDCNVGISFYNTFNYSPFITNNIMNGNRDDESPSQFGIVISGGNQVFILNNNITNFLTGISLNIVTTPYIKENYISAIDLMVEPQSGIVAISSDGQIRKNTITHHKYGIELGSSSPKIGANIITDNNNNGIYISAGSNPDLSYTYVWEEQYPLSGYNTIRENGLCTQMDYSEIYILESTVNLAEGCNTIADDREEQLSCGFFYLMDGEGLDYQIQANQNYWGEFNHSNPEGRFGELLSVNYDDWLLDSCTYGEGESELILANLKGEVYDTVYSTGIIASGLTDIETRYATANNYYYNNQFNQANQEYQGIIQNYGNSKESMQAYNRIYTIANIINNTPAEFNQLKNFYLQKASSQTDSLMIGSLAHLSDLCVVSAVEYIPAINKFDNIAQQNPNTDLALYRQIDALTTSLLMPQDSSLNKGVLGKYSVNSLSEYSNKLSELLRTRGKSGVESEQTLLPTEFTLYQNYPNPFNPTTIIKYDLPNASEVSLIIYDILGRKVKELVNTKQQAGRYEIQFNASNLASGVYIYQLMAKEYISSKKMILLK